MYGRGVTSALALFYGVWGIMYDDLIKVLIFLLFVIMGGVVYRELSEKRSGKKAQNDRRIDINIAKSLAELERNQGETERKHERVQQAYRKQTDGHGKRPQSKE